MTVTSRGFVRSVSVRSGDVESWDRYPFSIPAVRNLGELKLDPRVTFFVGENGSGKSTLLEAIAVAAGFNPEGGTKNFNFATRESHSSLGRHLRLVRNARRETDGFFLRAESYYNVASEVDALNKVSPGLLRSYGGKSLHDQSHGESFIAMLTNRLEGNGLYIFDEPEAALSPIRQMACLVLINDLVGQSSQFIIATHSPIIMAYPGATIYLSSEEGIVPIAYEDTEHYGVTRAFLDNRDQMLKELLE